MKHICCIIRTCMLLALFTVFISSAAATVGVPDLSGEKGARLFFVLGCLDEYLGRDVSANPTNVEHFYAGEQLKAFVFMAYLKKIASDQNIDPSIEIENRDGHIYFRSAALSDLIATLYDRRYFSYEQFAGRDENLKYAFLAGAYYRYMDPVKYLKNKEYGYRFANASEKASLTLRLLLDLGCGDLMKCTEPAIPAANTVSFKPTEGLLEWFEKYPGKWALERADSLMGMPSDDELQIYCEVIEGACAGLFDGCELEMPCSVFRTARLLSDGFGTPNVPESFEPTMVDLREKNNQVISLKRLESDSIRVVDTLFELTDRNNLSLTRIGFSTSGKEAAVIVMYGSLASNCRGQTVAAFLKKRQSIWEIASYTVRNPRR